MLKILALLSVALFFFACQGEETVFIKQIKNDSSQQCTFYFFGPNNTALFSDTVIVAAGTTEKIYSYFEENSSINANQSCGIYTDQDDTISVETTSGGKLIKSLYADQDWEYLSYNNEQICTFVITDGDIQ